MNLICFEKSPRTRSRKAPFLPRFGFFVDVAGRRVTYRQIPMIETLLNLRERGFSAKNLRQIALEQFNEIVIPRNKKMG